MLAVGNSLALAAAAFAAATVVVIGFGVYLTLLADELAERSALGRVFIGAVALGALTSVAEIGTSLTAALQQHAELAVSNALGSVAAQTAFIAVADLFYRRANLEHSAASEPNLVLTALLILLVTLVLAAWVVPDLAVFTVHPASYLLLAAYLFGTYLVSRSGRTPMWRPRTTSDSSQEDQRRVTRSGSMAWLVFRFLAVGVLVGLSGAVLSESGFAISRLAGLSESFVGVLLTGVASSMPELITALTAVRIGALTLAVSNLIGGNAFDVVIVALADFAYTAGPIVADAGGDLPLLLVTTLLMNAILLIGMLRRERHGPGNIGLEGVLLLVVYGGLVATLTFSGLGH